MNFATERPFADPDKAARKLLELANAAEADRDQRIAIELINLPFLRAGGSPDEYHAGIERAIGSGPILPVPLVLEIKRLAWLQGERTSRRSPFK